jgi:uncharacterized protein YqjF (DUF2071 family)
MRWCDLAFLHWPVSAALLRPLIPNGLNIDTYDGRAWVGVVPFRMEGVRMRGAPPIPTTHAFPEVNLRTYVHAADRAGVWFFSLDAASRLAVRGARVLYDLPYFAADISITAGAATIMYDSKRVHRGVPPARFMARYEPIGAVYEASPGTLDHFLVERYCMFMCGKRRGLGLLDIDHEPWPLQRAHAEVTLNTLAQAAGIALPDTQPIVHFSRALDVRAWTRTDLA